MNFCIFENANASNSDFTEARLFRANVEGCTLSGAVFTESSVSSLMDSDHRQARLEEPIDIITELRKKGAKVAIRRRKATQRVSAPS